MCSISQKDPFSFSCVYCLCYFGFCGGGVPARGGRVVVVGGVVEDGEEDERKYKVLGNF